MTPPILGLNACEVLIVLDVLPSVQAMGVPVTGGW